MWLKQTLARSQPSNVPGNRPLPRDLLALDLRVNTISTNVAQRYRQKRRQKRRLLTSAPIPRYTLLNFDSGPSIQLDANGYAPTTRSALNAKRSRCQNQLTPPNRNTFLSSSTRTRRPVQNVALTPRGARAAFWRA